ncbi:hypothetical protein MASR2M15_01410 [Anaerolineales bacterium]
MQDETRKKVMGSLVRHAFTRWETIVTIILTAILVVFFSDITILNIQWNPAFWIALGSIALGALVFSTLTDPSEVEKAVAKEFEQQFDLGHIRNPASRERLHRALEYRRNMMKLIEQSQGSLKTHLKQTVYDINDWIGHMYDLAKHIDSFEGNVMLEEDLKQVPRQIQRTEQTLERESDEAVQNELQNKLQQLRVQQQQLESAVNNGKRAQIQLESTLASLGTAYAQMSHLGTKEVDSARAQRLRLEIQDEISSLQDTIEAMDEVQAQNLYMR